MAKRLYVPRELRGKVSAFLKTSALEVEMVDDEGCDLRVAASPARGESSADTLEAGGWIRCATAWGMAKKHGLALGELGKLINALDIKIRECCLGCFK